MHIVLYSSSWPLNMYSHPCMPFYSHSISTHNTVLVPDPVMSIEDATHCPIPNGVGLGEFATDLELFPKHKLLDTHVIHAAVVHKM